jgi:mRNA interferase RelE/StbE
LSEYRLFETQQFQVDLRRLARSGHSRLLAKLRGVVYPQVIQHPHFGPNAKRLRGYTPGTWRYRIGAWLFFYEIDEEEHVVFLIAASHRSSAY